MGVRPSRGLVRLSGVGEGPARAGDYGNDSRRCRTRTGLLGKGETPMPHFAGRQLWLRAGVLLVLILAAIAAHCDSELSLILLVFFVVVEFVSC